MKLWTGLRVLALLRRLVKAAEAANDLSRERLALDHPEYGRTSGLRKSPKLVELGVAKVEDWNSKWRREHEGAEDQG